MNKKAAVGMLHDSRDILDTVINDIKTTVPSGAIHKIETVCRKLALVQQAIMWEMENE